MVAQTHQFEALAGRHDLDDPFDRVLAPPRIHVGLDGFFGGLIREVDGVPVGAVHAQTVGHQDADEGQNNDYE